MKNSNKKVHPVIYGIAVAAAVIGALIFRPADSAPADTAVQVTAAVTSAVSETTAQITEALPQETSAIQETAAETTAYETETEALTEAVQEEVSYYFRNQSTLDSHYEKHGIEMGFSSAEEYEAAASAVINSPDALHKTEKEDGDDVFYIEATNEFVVLSGDGFIRTYFLPSAGKSYYDRQ